MIEISKERLDQIFSQFEKLKIAVVGDLMLDRYVWGHVTRISPEAPVPVIDVVKENACLGGAANVTMNVHTLGAEVIPVGLIGADRSGDDMKALFGDAGFRTDGLILDASRPTTVKTRLIANDQHVARTDWEKRDPIQPEIEDRILDFLQSRMESLDGVILEDYNKGLLTPRLIHEVIALANFNHVKTFVDPKFENFFDYKNVTVFKPNRKEAADKLGMTLRNRDQICEAAKRLIERLSCTSLLVTLGEDGMMLFEDGKPPYHTHTKAVKVHDVSGAGDTVISTLAVASSAGATLSEAATLANHAAGIVCGEVGVVPIEKVTLYADMATHYP